MITKRLITILVSALLTTASAFCANVEYASQLLKSAAVAIGLPDKSVAPRTLSYYEVKGVRVVVRTDELGVVEHIGVPVFPKEMGQTSQAVVCDYVEFALMNHIFRFDEKWMNNGDFVFSRGSWDDLRRLPKDFGVEIGKVENKAYTVRLTGNGRDIVALSLPIIYDRICRSTMQELEARMISRLQSSPMAKQRQIKSEELVAADVRGVWQTRGESFLLAAITNTTYYNKKGYPVCVAAQPAMSLANLLLSPAKSLPDKKLRITAAYGTESLTISPRQLMEYAEAHGLKLYFGLKGCDGKKVEGTLYAVDETLECMHMFAVECPTAEMSRPGTVIEAKMQLYIPNTAKIKDK